MCRNGLWFSKDMSDSLPPKRLGYALVSTVGQTLEAQLGQLKAAGCLRIYREKVSGAKVDRKELGKLVKSIVAGWVPKSSVVALSTTQVAAIVTWTLNDPVAVAASAALHGKEKKAMNIAARKYGIRTSPI